MSSMVGSGRNGGGNASSNSFSRSNSGRSGGNGNNNDNYSRPQSHMAPSEPSTAHDDSTSGFSDDAVSFNESVFSGQGGAPSTLGGATSISGASHYQRSGKGSVGNATRSPLGVNVKSTAGLDENQSSATLGSIASEMIENRNRAGSDGTHGQNNQQNGTVQQGRGNITNNNNADRAQHRESATSRYEDASDVLGSTEDTFVRSDERDRHGMPTATLSGVQESYDYEDSPSKGRADSRRGAGMANASQFEQTDAASFIGQDPIAQAGDFNRDDADVVFLSSEMGSGPNRQPATRFKIHSINLHVHSPALSEMVDDLEDSQMELQLEEDAATLKLLFGLMYNRPAPSLGMNEWQVVLRLARCAQKYDVARAKEVAAAYFTEQEQLGALSPFMTYAFSVQYRLPALEEAAAERSVRYDIHHLPELVFNMMGFSAFQKLTAFHARRQSHYSDCLNAITMDPKELADQCYQTGGVCVIAPWNKLKNKLAWPRQMGRDGSKKPPEPADIIRKLVTEIGQIDCGTCSKALVEGALQAQLALESMPSYVDREDAF